MPRPVSPHLLVDISAHGYGHLSQTAPVVNELSRLIPGLRITVRSAAPLEVLQHRFQCEFSQINVALDFGMKMASAVEVLVDASAAAYREYHADWSGKVRRAAEQMRALQPDLLLANVPYLSMAAAHAAGIRAAAMCCLNWADIFHQYFPDQAEIHGQMLEAYNTAEIFLKVQPTMPMPDLQNTRTIGLIAQPGYNRRAQLEAALGATSINLEKLVLVAMGGIQYRLPMQDWPPTPGVRWLVPEEWNIVRHDVSAFDSLGLSFVDLLASCDAVLTKPGYGSFAEAASMGIPVLYVSRGNWSEQPYLVEWLQQHGICREVSEAVLRQGDLANALHELWQQPKPPVPLANGAGEAAEILAGML